MWYKPLIQENGGNSIIIKEIGHEHSIFLGILWGKINLVTIMMGKDKQIAGWLGHIA